MIQVDASAAPGVSGAPAVDQSGLVLGLLTLPAGDRGAAVQGFNFVIPSAAVRDLAIQWEPLGRAFLHSGIYLATLLLVSCILFRRSEV